MEYTIFILLLPLLSFLVLGIGGKWMTHRTAGIIGTTVLAVVVSRIELRHCLAVFLRSASGGRHFRHTYAL